MVNSVYIEIVVLTYGADLLVAQSDAHLISDQEVAELIPTRSGNILS